SSNWLTRHMDAFMSGLRVRYKGGLAWCLRWPKAIVGIALTVFFLSMFSVKYLKKEFIPSQDQNRFLITITNPLGVSIDYTDTLSKTQLEPWLLQQPEMNQYYAAVGGFQGGQVNTENIFVTMMPKDQRPRVGSDQHHESQLEFM